MTKFAHIDPVSRRVESTAETQMDLRGVENWHEIPPGVDISDPAQWVVSEEGEFIHSPEVPTREAVNSERDRRIRLGFTFQGHTYDFDKDSEANITGAGASAFMSVQGGAAKGDLRWSDPDHDFMWITAGNEFVPMDAHTCALFSQAARVHKQRHIFAAAQLKAMADTPVNFTDDQFWPLR